MKNKSVKIILLVILIIASFLRLWKITEVPVSLFGDELDVGYQAYSILKTGRDYNGNFLPLHFHSIAEWRTPLYLYTCVPTVAIFGITPLGVRLPAAIFGILNVLLMYLLVSELLNYGSRSMDSKKRNSFLTKSQVIALVSSAFLAVSPWHLQYSRAAFEVTQLLFFYLSGIYFFIKTLSNPKYFWLCALSLGLTPWIYSTAKFFTPMLLVFLFIVWFKDILAIQRKELVNGIATFFILGIPLVYAIFFSGGGQRFSYISVFSDPAMEGTIGFARQIDAAAESPNRSVLEKISTRIIHNKYSYWGGIIINNYFTSFSTNFLFNMGDLNRRHNIEGMGELHKLDVIPLLSGLIMFFGFYKNKKVKILIAFWILGGVLPSSLTRDGGNHATRLIVILPPIMFLLSYGLVEFIALFKNRWKIVVLTCYLLTLSLSFYFYQHNYWVHNPWYSERWWHAGFEETIKYLKANENKYDKIIFSNANEPPQIFFAAWYPYPPNEWQKGFKTVKIDGFSDLENIGKYYIGQMDKIGIYDLNKYLPDNSLYVAVEREVKINLIMEPGRVPPGLKLIKYVAYPSGEPAFYLFERSEK